MRYKRRRRRVASFKEIAWSLKPRLCDNVVPARSYLSALGFALGPSMARVWPEHGTSIAMSSTHVQIAYAASGIPAAVLFVQQLYPLVPIGGSVLQLYPLVPIGGTVLPLIHPLVPIGGTVLRLYPLVPIGCNRSYALYDAGTVRRGWLGLLGIESRRSWTIKYMRQ